MKEKIESKLDAIVAYILSKPVAKATGDDYYILASELGRITSKERDKEWKKSMKLLTEMVVAPEDTGDTNENH